MRARFVNEANFERRLDPKDAMRIGDLSIRAEQTLKQIIPSMKHIPELDNNDEENYVESKFYSVDTGNEYIDGDWGVSMLVGRMDPDDPIGVKFYSDATAFNGQDVSGENNNLMPLISVYNFTTQVWRRVIRDIEKHFDYDPIEWQETKKQRALYKKRELDPNDPEFLARSKELITDKGAYYEGHPNMVYDKELGWLDIQALFLANQKRGIVYDPETKKWIPKTDKPGLAWSMARHKWVPEKDQYK